MRHQQIEIGALTLEELAARLRHRKPLDPINFGELPHRARALRPLQLEGVAAGVGDVEAAPDGERRDHLAAGLFPRSEVEPRARRNRQPQLLGELALGRGPGILAVGVLTFRDRPSPVVLARPEWTAWMREQGFDDAVADAI